jgi:hypothetical protein
MVARKQIAMTPELGRRARRRAAELGVSFAEYVRRVVRNDLGETGPKPEVSALFDLVPDGRPTDIARDKERMITDAVGKALARKTARPGRRRR